MTFISTRYSVISPRSTLTRFPSTSIPVMLRSVRTARSSPSSTASRNPSNAIAIAHRPERFLDKERWAMDWYYPILCGALRGGAAEARVAAKWDTFVAHKRGVRCVSDQPWITAAETCELVMALDAIGLDDRARTLFTWVQFLRHDDGSYWTGMNFADDQFDTWGDYFTAEQPTWNSAAVVLAANALGGDGPTAGLFRGEGLPAGLTAEELIAAGEAIEGQRAARSRSSQPPLAD